MKRLVSLLLLLAAVVLCIGVPASAAVDLEWRPEYQVVHMDDPVSVSLYASSYTDWPISALDAVILYNSPYLHFYNLTYDEAAYNWLQSGFFWPSPDNINDELSDGDMFFTAWCRLGIPAIVGSDGLFITRFHFYAQSDPFPFQAQLTIPSVYGSAKTRVFDGIIPNRDIKGSLGTAKILVVPTGYLTSVAEAKALPDGTIINLAGPITTRSFGSYFYIEDHDRKAGIRVNCSPSQVPVEGSTPIISGVIRTSNGERMITGGVHPLIFHYKVPRPLGMNTRAVTTGLNPTGLLVTLSGRVTFVSANKSVFIIDDGANQITVELHQVTAPPLDSFVAVTGALGADSLGPVLRVNSDSDIRIYQE
ncbi:MAG TPA: hypothetical protein PLU88_00275 [Armatimonadota bacterium]|nr:hypothetical protein [Armatimonadota bacterium]